MYGGYVLRGMRNVMCREVLLYQDKMAKFGS